MLKPHKIHCLSNSYRLELRERAFQLTGSVRMSNDITELAVIKLMQNSFWIWNEKRAKQYLDKIVNRECKKFIQSKRE